MQARGIQSGFDFLLQPAGFDIGESLIPYDALDKYWKAFLVGVLNTLRVALAGIVMATAVGAAVGIGRFSRNAIVRALCYAYVEVFRNVPVLLQLLMWYLLFADWLPPLLDAPSLAGSSTSARRGSRSRSPSGPSESRWRLAGRCWASPRGGSIEAGRYASSSSPVVIAAFTWFPCHRAGRRFRGLARGGAPTAWSIPKPEGFAMEGGVSASPEFLAVLLGPRALYGGIHRRGRARRYRIRLAWAGGGGREPGAFARAVHATRDPSAGLRVIIPPMTSQYLNITKNSSLAVAIGYPDVVSIANTALNQTGARSSASRSSWRVPHDLALHFRVHELVQPPRGGPER
jgi:general L-amino acid transport system permease protein